MNQLTKTLAIISAVVSVGFSTSIVANPCTAIAQACMKEGYYKGGNTVGKGLVEDCVQPVVNKTKTLSNATFSDSDLTNCNAMLMKKMQSH